MTGAQLLAKANSFGDINISNADGLLWLDMKLTELAPTIGSITTLSFADVEADTPEDLPDDFGTLVEWMVDDDTYDNYKKIKIRGNNKIYFPYDIDDIDMLYRAITTYSDLSVEFPVDKMAHTAICYWLIAMYWDQEGEGDDEESIQMSERWFNKYEISLLKAIDNINNRDIEETVATEDVMPSRSRESHVTYGDDDYE